MDKDVFNISKKNSERGDSKIYYDKTTKVAIAQWYNNKIITVVSTLSTRGKVPVKRRKGSNLLDLDTENYIHAY